MRGKQTGFNLIEVIIGMLVLSIAITMMLTTLFPQANQAVDALYRIRSAELGQSILNEIWSKRYDENTNPGGGEPCGKTGQPACTTVAGPEAGETRNSWDDIDDFNGMTQATTLLGSAQTYGEIYPQYQLAVAVTSGGVNRTITIDITTPNGEVITFNAIRSNF